LCFCSAFVFVVAVAVTAKRRIRGGGRRRNLKGKKLL